MHLKVSTKGCELSKKLGWRLKLDLGIPVRYPFKARRTYQHSKNEIKWFMPLSIGGFVYSYEFMKNLVYKKNLKLRRTTRGVLLK